jgi:hypothetical protein
MQVLLGAATLFLCCCIWVSRPRCRDLSFRTQTDTMIPVVLLLTWDCYFSPVAMTFFSHTAIITFLSGPGSQDLGFRTQTDICTDRLRDFIYVIDSRLVGTRDLRSL